MSSTTPDLGTWLDAVAGIAAAVSDDEPVSALLGRVAQTACALLDYDFCAVFLPAPDGASLVIAGSHGLSAGYVEQVNAERPILLHVRGAEEAPTSVAFRTAEVVALGDVDSEPAFPWGGVAHEQGYRALVAVPLLQAGRAVGTLNCYRRSPHVFGADELRLVATLATQVAVALGTAQVRAREQGTIRELERAERIHGELTAASLRGEGVVGVATSLARLVGCGVVVEDVGGAVLAASGVEGAEGVEGAAGVPGAEGAGRAASPAFVRPVLLDGEEVARIRLARAPGDVGGLDLRAVEHAATVTALELLRERTAGEVEERLRGSLLADVVAGGDLARARVPERARRTGWDPAPPQVLLAVREVGEAWEGRVRAPLAALARGVLEEATRGGARPLVAAHRGDLVALVPQPPGVERSAVLGAVAELEDRARRRGWEVRVVVAAGTEVAAAPSTYRLVRGALDLGADAGPGVVDLEQAGLDHLLLRLEDPELLRGFVRSVLGAVVAYDEARGTRLLRTLDELVASDLDRAEAARRLHVHVNTVAQRVRRVEELSGLRVGRPRDLLQLTAALAVARVAGLLGA
ncbi:helix-turn-helix domain-containing protein [Nocardioides sp. CPCC 205120]|uniref:helix-turn-helix domain-containing protein n=1 Tax=Nocardioides sp. CPCC 205120 TaxID=3406462 RepID=UPI003B512DC1